MKRYFVTGTDTGVGKTFVTAALARRSVAAGKRVFAFKPIETGVVAGLGEDQTELVAASGGWQTGALCGVYQFKQPAAPSVAATSEARTIDLERIQSVYDQGASNAEVVLVEGAGGIRVPVTDTVDMAGLATLLNLPLIIVTRAGLGTINHTLLTIEAARHSKLKIAAVVMSRRPDDDRAFVASNATEIRRRWDGSLLVFSGEASELDALLG